MIKKPLVITNGLIEQLQAGDSLSNDEMRSLTNDNAGSLVIGTPVYVSGADSVDKAKADASGTKDVIGLVADVSIATTVAGNVLTDGPLSATTGQWDAVTEETGGLTPGGVYFLDDANLGKMTQTAPTADGKYVSRLGTALSTTEFEISIQTPIKL